MSEHRLQSPWAGRGKVFAFPDRCNEEFETTLFLRRVLPYLTERAEAFAAMLQRCEGKPELLLEVHDQIWEDHRLYWWGLPKAEQEREADRLVARDPEGCAKLVKSIRKNEERMRDGQ